MCVTKSHAISVDVGARDHSGCRVLLQGRARGSYEGLRTNRGGRGGPMPGARGGAGRPAMGAGERCSTPAGSKAPSAFEGPVTVCRSASPSPFSLAPSRRADAIARRADADGVPRRAVILASEGQQALAQFLSSRGPALSHHPVFLVLAGRRELRPRLLWLRTTCSRGLIGCPPLALCGRCNGFSTQTRVLTGGTGGAGATMGKLMGLSFLGLAVWTAAYVHGPVSWGCASILVW